MESMEKNSTAMITIWFQIFKTDVYNWDWVNDKVSLRCIF